MAFRPVVMPGHTIRVTPLIVKGMGMDFDGDTASFHVPASADAVRDAYAKMLPSRNLLSVSEFKAHQLPSQELVAGLHAASTAKTEGKRARTFATKADAIRAWKRGELGVGDPVEVAEG
jgi:DNA-directed RNA polymerase subunit beta'